MKFDPSQVPFDSSKSFSQVFSKFNPCPHGLEYSQRFGGNLCEAAAAWDEAPNAEFLLWALQHVCRAEKSEARAFMCWCLRHTPFGDGRTLWELLVDERSRRVVEVAERHVRGEATDHELFDARLAAQAAFATIEETADRKSVRFAARAAPRAGIRGRVWNAAVFVVWDTVKAVAHAAAEAVPEAQGDEVFETTYAAAVKSQVDSLRVQYGNPVAPYLAMEDDGQTADRP
jgi:hypothetical protein